MEWLDQPYFVLRSDCSCGVFRWTKPHGPVGLMFEENERWALEVLLENSEVPDAFYQYWKDATNTTGYSSKLLLMLSAIEALCKKNSSGTKYSIDFIKLEQILGKDLKEDLWGTKEDKGKRALRHRLVHGEYFEKLDHLTNYVNHLHSKIIAYFNGSILKNAVIHEGVVNPQRHPSAQASFNTSNRNLPVCDAITFATCSGRPSAKICPPVAPPSGPGSMIQSADLMTSRLCSTITRVLQAFTSFWRESLGFNNLKA